MNYHNYPLSRGFFDRRIEEENEFESPFLDRMAAPTPYGPKAHSHLSRDFRNRTEAVVWIRARKDRVFGTWIQPCFRIGKSRWTLPILVLRWASAAQRSLFAFLQFYDGTISAHEFAPPHLRKGAWRPIVDVALVPNLVACSLRCNMESHEMDRTFLVGSSGLLLPFGRTIIGLCLVDPDAIHH